MTTGKASRHPPAVIARVATWGTTIAAMLVPINIMPSARPRCRANHMLTARLHVTGVEPMPISPSTVQKLHQPMMVPGTNQNAANTTMKAISDRMATRRTP